MSNYLDYLNKISSSKTFLRKVNYIKYNFGKYLTFKNPAQVNILEIGPGLGEALSYLNSNGFNNIDVVDNDQNILDNIHNKHKVRTLFKADNLADINAQLTSYEIIIATQLLEHLPKDSYILFLEILFKHLKKDGRIIITVPNMANPFTICERYADITHTNGFTDNSLRELANQCDIPDTKVEIQEFNIPPYSFLNIIRIILQKILHFFILVLSIVNGGSYSKLLTPNITMVIKK